MRSAALVVALAFGTAHGREQPARNERTEVGELSQRLTPLASLLARPPAAFVAQPLVSSFGKNNALIGHHQAASAASSTALQARKSPRRTGVITAAEVVPKEDFRLAAALLVLGPTLVALPVIAQALGGFFTLLGALILFQTFNIRFVFDDEAFEVKTNFGGGGEEELAKTGENFVVGGENRWKYDTFVNWEFFPSVDVPVLVYFKETQTPKDKWMEGPGQFANSADALAKGAVPGQIHFFPCIANAQELKAQFEAKKCAKL